MPMTTRSGTGLIRVLRCSILNLVVEPGGHRYFEPSRCLMSTVPHRVGRATRPLATYLADRVLFADRGARRACRGAARPSWTARSSPSAKTARSSRPASRSGPPCKPNTTTPPATVYSSGRPVPATAQRPQREPSIMIHLTRITHIMPMTGCSATCVVQAWTRRVAVAGVEQAGSGQASEEFFAPGDPAFAV
jgi:hypothetical protein